MIIDAKVNYKQYNIDICRVGGVA